MKSIFIFILLFTSCTMYSQDGWVYSISKDGKETHKECVAIKIEPMMAVFHVSGSTYEVFDMVGNDLDGLPLWESRATGKRAHRVVQNNGSIAFWKTEKKAFYYKP